MAEHESHRARVKKLLAQDPDINENQLKEFRMSLEANLESWETKSARIRRAIMIALIGYAASWVFIMLAGALQTRMLNLSGRHTAQGWLYTMSQLVFLGGFGLMCIAMIVGGWSILLYLYKYGPGLKRARFDVQTTMMLELRQQVEQLRRDLEQRDK